jgi:hypothetical protein
MMHQYNDTDTDTNTNTNTNLELACDLYLYNQLQKKEKSGIIIPRMTTLLSDTTPDECMLELRKEMEKQGKRDLVNIFEKHALSTWCKFPDLFTLDNKLDIINKFWFSS